MKKSILALSVVLVLFSCKSENTGEGVSTNDVNNSMSADGSNKDVLPEIKFEEETHDFGRITQGERVSYAFKFKNTGKSNLIISSASGSCGCTVPEWPKEPIKPGEENKINVVFSSEGKQGMVEKTVTLVTNCEPSTRVLTIKTNIIVPTNANPNDISGH
ncbi:MAG: DUF1573 domain-containing protein [Bacteroidetes bacterium]|nr:DUF1573 domain-containing protein [Bacteroidota bacterium]